MKTLLRVAGIVVLVIALLGGGLYWVSGTPAPTPKPAPTDVSSRATAPPGIPKPEGSSTSDPKGPPPSRQASLHAPATMARSSIFDSTSLMSAAFKALASGSADEKGWAWEVLSSCRGYDSSPTEDVQAARRAAYADLKLRCAEVSSYSPSELRDLLKRLRRESADSDSPYGRVSTMVSAIRASASRDLTADEAALVTGSLYSNDPVLQRKAFWVVAGLLRRQDPAKEQAFIAALADAYVNKPLSGFERAEQCAALNLCGTPDVDSTTAAPGAPPPLVQSYRDAVARHAPMEQILLQ